LCSGDGEPVLIRYDRIIAQRGDQVDGKAIIFCEGAFARDIGKSAHGLVRHSRRYDVVAILDSTLAGRDAGEVLDGQSKGIPIMSSLAECAALSPEYFVIGMAPEGGRLPQEFRATVMEAMRNGLNVDSGLHDFLSDDDEISSCAANSGITIRDVRKPPPRSELKFFSGEINQVKAKRIAVLGTDCALGKRTTSVLVVKGLQDTGTSAELVGTGQTSWLQGVRYGILLDSLVNDFVGGELERAVVDADRNESPDVIVIEGQSCLTHPSGSGGFEILGSARPHGVILAHAPIRKTYSGYDDYPLVPPEAHIRTIEELFGSRVIAMALNPEGFDTGRIPEIAAQMERQYGIPCCDPLTQGVQKFVDAVRAL
jgi:uncharacterized NAD-dependent epimerase/dehydratase family protein